MWLLYRCAHTECRKNSVRNLDEGTHKVWILGCHCGRGLEIIGWLPAGVVPVIDEKEV